MADENYENMVTSNVLVNCLLAVAHTCS